MTDMLFLNTIRYLNQLNEENKLTDEQIKAISAFVVEITNPARIGAAKRISSDEFSKLQEQTLRILHDISISEHESNRYTTR